jgi:twinkle protein
MQLSSKVIGREACPECQKHGRDQSEDNLAVYDDGHKWCFSCLTYTPPEIKDEDVYTYEYLPLRNVDKSTFEFYGAKTKISRDGKPVSLGFPYPNSSYKIRTLDKKAFYSIGDIAKAGLFGRNKFAASSHKTVTITEGELDALSLYQVVRSPVVSVHSAASAGTDAGIDRAWLNSFERIVLAFDGDEAGREATRKVAKLFDYNKVFVVSFPGGTRKDANDYLRAGERDELYTIWTNARRFLPDEIKSSWEDFKKILADKPRDGVPYPFPTLNYMTYGIRTGESVLITAMEGVGKTEVMHAIEHQLLTETEDPIGAIFLEEPKRRHLQAIAGIHLARPAHLPDSGVTDAQTFQAVQDVVRVDERLHIYSHFGSDDPEVILDTIRFLVSARGCRYILLDHITMVVSGLGGKDERISLDYLSTRLEMMVKELDFALIVVSHVNDDGLTRGSRNISKIADIRLDLYRDITASDPITRRITRMVVSKNRFCGRTGPAGELLFDPATYTLNEDMGYGTPTNDNSPGGRNAAMVA